MPVKVTCHTCLGQHKGCMQRSRKWLSAHAIYNSPGIYYTYEYEGNFYIYMYFFFEHFFTLTLGSCVSTRPSVAGCGMANELCQRWVLSGELQCVASASASASAQPDATQLNHLPQPRRYLSFNTVHHHHHHRQRARRLQGGWLPGSGWQRHILFKASAICTWTRLPQPHLVFHLAGQLLELWLWPRSDCRFLILNSWTFIFLFFAWQMNLSLFTMRLSLGSSC